jgi:hypothetical protein
MKKVLGALGLALAAGLLVGLVAFPASAQYPPQGPTCGVSDTTLAVGDQVTVSGAAWGGSTVRFALNPEAASLGSTAVRPNGSISSVLGIPQGTEAGAHALTCSGTDVAGKAVTISNDIRIMGASEPQVVGATGGIAFTGSGIDVPLWTVLAACLLGTGAVLLVAGRRRARRSVKTGS